MRAANVTYICVTFAGHNLVTGSLLASFQHRSQSQLELTAQLSHKATCNLYSLASCPLWQAHATAQVDAFVDLLHWPLACTTGAILQWVSNLVLNDSVILCLECTGICCGKLACENCKTCRGSFWSQSFARLFLNAYHIHEVLEPC